MNMMQAAVLEPVGNGEIALRGVKVDAVLRGLLSEVTVTQIYENLEATNIEAVYTFPLPLDAVLMELTLEFNGEVLHGEVKPNSEAEADYEDAIEEGDSAVLLTQVQPGLFTVNVGNLMAGEKAILRFRYAQLHRWQGDSLRFHLPTTLAPRYGDPSAAGLREYETPEQTLTANYGFALNLTIEGALAEADVDSPSHKVIVEKQKEQLHISLSGGTAIMDRDFILVVREPDNFVGEGLYAQEKDGVVALASFHPQLPEAAKSQPRCIKLVVDCSGSMSGDSIYQARAALNEILELLNPDDWFNITLFGSHPRLLFREPVPADEMHVHQAVRMLRNLDADMGGTELRGALESTYACGTPGEASPDLLLITDGEVWEYNELIESARRSGHRLFTVGVGSAVSESLLRALAEISGGACELVSPNEEMAERIVRHFKRIHQPAVNSSSIHWPTETVLQSPAAIEAVYADDTLHLFGWLPTAPDGEAVLALELAEGVQHESVGFSEMLENGEQTGTLARMAAHSRLSSLDDEAAKALAVEYQLVTSQTSCVLVKLRDAHDKAEEIPVLRKVPHQLAAGYGGMGTIDCCMSAPVTSDFCDDIPYGSHHSVESSFDVELEHGIEVDITDVDLENGILSYKGRQVLLYIQDHGGNVQKALDDGSTGKKYHVADCRTLQEMRANKRFERYVATNNLRGSFFISGNDWRTHQTTEGKAELKVCKNCLKKLNYQGYSIGGKSWDIFKKFTLGEFFSTYSSFFKHMPKRRAGTGANDDYPDDWDDISGRYKAAKNYCCEQCHVDLSEHKSLLHVHHISGIKKDNNDSNLRVLCSDCHRKKTMHEQLFVSHEDMRLINQLRRAQAIMPNGDWEEIIELADPCVKGLLKLCQHSHLELPEVGYELPEGNDTIIAELELAWPVSKVGVAIGEEDKSVAEKTGWEIWSMIDAIDRFDQFQQGL